jgi:hypothetical protein
VSRDEQRYYAKKFKAEELIGYLKKNKKKVTAVPV